MKITLDENNYDNIIIIVTNLCAKKERVLMLTERAMRVWAALTELLRANTWWQDQARW